MENTIKWKEYVENSDDWDKKILDIAPSNIYQTDKWGKYKEIQNWRVVKFICFINGNEEIAYMQIFIREYFKIIRINYSSGVMVINKLFLNYQEVIHTSFFKKLKIESKFFFSYTRIKIHKKDSLLSKYNLCVNRLSAPQTVILNTKQGKERETYSSHHRRKFKKNINDIYWCYKNDEKNINAIIEILRKLKKEKNIKGKIISNKELLEITKIINVIIIVGYNKGIPVVGCVVYYINNWAIYACGGATLLGRQCNLGYYLIEKLFVHLFDKKIDKFDFGGVDINNYKVNGVNRFKLGFGGYVIDDEVEIEEGNFLICYLINKIIGVSV
jgi:lipid II:glycine glycyltransferase (peptidoglycan interpeptide bridge formation enzyme)